MSTILDRLAYGLGYVSLAALAGVIALAVVVVARDVFDRVTATRRARRAALASLVDLRTGEVLPALGAARGPALSRRRFRRLW